MFISDTKWSKSALCIIHKRWFIYVYPRQNSYKNNYCEINFMNSKVLLKNLPRVKDIETMLVLLKSLGSRIKKIKT